MIEVEKILENIEASMSLLFNEYKKLTTDEEIFYVQEQIFDNIEESKRTIALLESNVALIRDIIISKQRPST